MTLISVVLMLALIHSCSSRQRLTSECGSYETECLQALIEKVEFVQHEVEQISQTENLTLTSTNSLETTSRQQLAAFLEYVTNLRSSLTDITHTDSNLTLQIALLNTKMDLLIERLSQSNTNPQSNVLLGLISLITVLLFGILISMNCTHCPTVQTAERNRSDRMPLLNDDDEVNIPPARLELDNDSSSDYDCQPPDQESLQLSPVSSRRE